ncbi:hypothetical protein ALC56_11390, partial [Trachymyrmex septentrionalis]
DKIASHISRGSDPGNDPRIICCLPYHGMGNRTLPFYDKLIFKTNF